MRTSNAFVAVLALALAAVTTAACTPTVQVAAPEPIVINLNINHEVKVKLSEDVEGMITAEENAAQVGSRGIDSDVQMGDSRAVRLAKESGAIGERADGYLGVVPDKAGDADLVERVNAERRTSYEALATRYETDLVSVQSVAGQRRLDEAVAGEAILPADGVWTVKP